MPQGSGRTDAASMLWGRWRASSCRLGFRRRIWFARSNRTLPERSACWKLWWFRIHFMRGTRRSRKPTSIACSPSSRRRTRSVRHFLRGTVYPYSWNVNLEVLQRAAAAFVGEHDFRSFAAPKPDLSTRTMEADADTAVQTETRTTVRTIFASEWREHVTDGYRVLVYRVRGNGFLHHMVRNLVGTTLDVGRGYTRVEEIPRILVARDRAAAGPTAPARGLFLHSVEY